MRDKDRIKPFTDELARIWETNCPDWRFGQFIENVFGSIGVITFYLEDDEMIKEFEKYFKEKK